MSERQRRERRLQLREFRTRLEVLDAAPEMGEGRLVCGQAAPFGYPIEVFDPWTGETYTEDFARGAFAKTIADADPSRVKFFVQHDAHKLPSGHARLLEERTHGLYAKLWASRITRNDEVLELIRDGTLTDLSVGFFEVPDKDDWDEEHTHVTRREVRLMEISVVTWGAFGDKATISNLRDLQMVLTPPERLSRPNLERVRAMLAPYGIKV